uniref:Aminopeptidase n=2 Tax=Parascaris univalens TaxID=6257 RepID=A0A915AG91_PARUN
MNESADKTPKATDVVTPVNGGGKRVEYKPAPKKQEKITCSKSTALLLFLIAVACVILSSFVTFWVTKGIYDHSMEITPLIDEAALESSTLTGEGAPEDEADGYSPTAAELRLPKNISPVWYNITLKTFLPGYVDIPPERNLTFDAALIIKFRVNEATNKIVMNALKLNFSDNIEKYKLLQEGESKPVQVMRFRRAEAAEISENATESEPLPEDEDAVAETPVEEDEEESATTETPQETTVAPKENRKTVKIAAHAQVKKMTVNATLEMVTFELDDELRPGEEYYFQLLYTGEFDKQLSGLYLSQYTDGSGKRKYAAVTQMQPTDARRMVPCFDEPEFKAVWKVKIIHPSGTVAISNGIELKDAIKTDNPSWVVTTFKETLPMSSYLLALAVTDFDFNEGSTGRGTRFRVWSRKEALNQTLYALESGIKALEFYENFYDIPFPLEKQDMIALPDFASGAMENWGLITFREKYLIYDSRLYSPLQKMRVAIVVAHELSHQWFGNLVTMRWWNDLWLNEGFATFMEYLGADAISQGNFRMGEYFITSAVDAALQRDARASSHPLYFPIEKAEDVSEVFDDITYDKGAAIVHMIEDVMGSDNFKKGLNIYLNRHKYSNAANNDLWSALNEAVPDTLLAWNGEKLDIRDFASKWTEQMGYPMVEIRRLNSTRIELHQKRFKWDDDALEREKFRNAKFWYKYDIPIWYEINGEEKAMEWLHEDSAQGMNLKADELLVLNSGARGFYRVNYNKECWQKIVNQLLDDHTKIGVRSRARIIDDAFALAQAGHLSYEIPLNISAYLRKEEEYLPWSMALDGFAVILSNFDDEPEVEHVREFLDPLVAPLYDRIDWSKLNTSYLDEKRFFENELEYDIISQYCAIRKIDCTERLVDLFKGNLLDVCQGDEVLSSECSKVPIPVRAMVYCEGVRQSAEKVWNKMFELYQRERVQVERERLLIGLTCSRDTFTLKKLLDLASNLNDTSVRLQDAPTVFRSISVRDVGSKIIFDYFQDNWMRLYREMNEQQTLLSRIIASGTNVRGDRQVSQLETFIKKHKKQTSKLDIFGQQLEVSKTQTLWLTRNFVVLTEWFKKQNEQRKTG